MGWRRWWPARQAAAPQAAPLAARLALAAEHSGQFIVLIGADRRIAWANPAFLQRAGCTLEQLAGRRAATLAARANDPQLLRRLRRTLLRGERLRAELLVPAAGGRETWIDADLSPLPGGGVVAVGADVTERRRQQDQWRRAARVDTLTGLPNRSAAHERIERALAHARAHPGYGFAVLFVDLDRFRHVNDTLGHAAGDELLCRMATRIEQALRPGDAVARVDSGLHVAARTGGDEFVVVLDGVRDADDARAIARRLLDALAEPCTLGAHVLHGSASIGIVGPGHAAASADELLRDADIAMVEAQRAGRGRAVVFERGMHERMLDALRTEAELRDALAAERLFLVYQPVVDLDGGALVGVEALLRWRHPQRGVVAPLDFLPAADEAGLSDAIGSWVLRQACRQFAAWRRELGERAPRTLAVNLARAQLQQPGLAAEIRHLLDSHDLEACELELEITEALAASDPRVQATLRELKAMGVRLALDDFGTGGSSLSTLQQLAVDTVKIDRSLVSQAGNGEVHRMLIEATVRVAQALGMGTVAEGVETASQAVLLERLRCHRGQGFLWSAALAPDELAHWVLAGRDAAVVID